MPTMTPEQIAQAQTVLDRDSGFQQALQAARDDLRRGGGRFRPGQASQLLQAAAQRAGVQLPQDYNLGTLTGKIEHADFYDRNSNWIPAAVIGGAFAGAGAAGAAGAGSAGAATGTEAALGPVAATGGTTAATVPTSLAASSGGGMLNFLSKYGSAASDIGQIASGAAGGLAAGRRADNQATAQAANFNLNAPTTQAQQVARGDLMAANIPQASHTGTGRNISFTGGVGPQLFTQDTTDAGNALKRQALQHLLSGDQQIDPTRAGVGENLAAGVGIGSSILGALSRYGRR